MVFDGTVAAATTAQTAMIAAIEGNKLGMTTSQFMTKLSHDQADSAQDATLEVNEQTSTELNRMQKMAKWIRDTKNQIANWVSENTRWRTTLMTNLKSHWERMSLKYLSMVKFMQAMARFFPIIKVALIVIMIFSNALQYVIMILAALAIALLLVIYKILSITGLDWICIGIYWFIMVFVPFVIYAVVFTLLFGIIFVFCLILALLNAITSGGMKNFLFCENNPAGWYKMANYQLRNIYSREFFCSKPCLRGYAPDASGSFCEKQKRAAPNFCPQASVMRLFTATGRKDRKVGYSQFNDKVNMNYRTSMPIQREKMLKDHFIGMRKYMEACNDKLKTYDGVTKSICASVDTIEKYNLYGMKKNDINRLKVACAQSFCNSVNSYPFCANLSGISQDADELLIKMLVKFFISVIIFLIVILTFMRVLKES